MSIVTLSWTSFELIEPANIKQQAEKIRSIQNDTYKKLYDDLKSRNNEIEGKFKVNNKEIFYEKGKELEDFLKKNLIDLVNINPDILYDEAMTERKKILDYYMQAVESKIQNLVKEYDRNEINRPYAYLLVDKSTLEKLRSMDVNEL